MPQCEQVRGECAHHFQDIATQQATMIERMDGLKESVDKVSKVIVGNGTPQGSVVDRLARIETNALGYEKDNDVSRDRFWKAFAVCVSLGSLAIVAIKAFAN